LCCGDPDTGDLIEPGHHLGERGDLLIDAGLHGVDVGGDAIDPGQHGPKQERMVIGEPTGERLLQPARLGPHRSTRHVREDLRVAFPGDQRGHPADRYVGHQRGERHRIMPLPGRGHPGDRAALRVRY
jgi:hypothetical protein